MVTLPIHSDYLFLQPLLLARLEDQVPGVPWEAIEHIGQAADGSTGAVRGFLMWDGDRPDIGHGARLLHQRWLVVLNVRNARQTKEGHRNNDAGPLLSKVHLALVGWQPQGLARAFIRTTGRAPNYQTNSALLPLSFEIQLSI